MEPAKMEPVVDARATTVPPSSTYEEVGRLILVIVFSLLLIGLFVDYLFTQNAALLAIDTIPGTALATIVPHYFKK